MIVTTPHELRQHLDQRKTTRGKTALCARLRPDLERLHEPLYAAKLGLRSLARRVAELDREILALDERLTPLVATATAAHHQLLAVSTGHAGQLLVTAGQNIDRLHSDGALAALCGQPDPRLLRPTRPLPSQPRVGRPRDGSPHPTRPAAWRRAGDSLGPISRLCVVLVPSHPMTHRMR
jgi:hypothetical protein